MSQRLDNMNSRHLLLIGSVALIVGLATGLISASAMLHGYLCAFAFLLGVPLGAACLTMLNELIPGRWARPLRSSLAASVRTIPLVALLAIPPIAGAMQLYGVGHWQHVDEPRAIYLSYPFFLGRAGLYWLLWIAISIALNRVMWRRPECGDTNRFPALAASGIIVYVLTISFAAIDWLAALDRHWYSSAFGLYVLMGQVLLALSLAIVTTEHNANGARESERTRDTRMDMGTVLLTFVSLHAYIGFSQFLIIWNGNLPHEIAWYARRIQGGWLAVPILLGLMHFGLPFVLLLSRNIKASRIWLKRVCVILIAMRFLETMWFVLPAADRQYLAGLAMLFCTFGASAIWWAYFADKRRSYAAIEAGDAPSNVDRERNR